MRGHIAPKNGRYYPVISIKDPATGRWKRKWLTGYKTKREAEKACASAVTQVGKGMLMSRNRETVAGLFHDYFRTTGANRVRTITLHSYQSLIDNHLIPRVGAKLASALTPDDLNLVMANMVETGKSPTTVRYLLRVVHRVLDDAVRKEKLARNVADLAEPPPTRKAETEVWDMADIFNAFCL